MSRQERVTDKESAWRELGRFLGLNKVDFSPAYLDLLQNIGWRVIRLTPEVRLGLSQTVAILREVEGRNSARREIVISARDDALNLKIGYSPLERGYSLNTIDSHNLHDRHLSNFNKISVEDNGMAVAFSSVRRDSDGFSETGLAIRIDSGVLLARHKFTPSSRK